MRWQGSDDKIIRQVVRINITGGISLVGTGDVDLAARLAQQLLHNQTVVKLQDILPGFQRALSVWLIRMTSRSFGTLP